MHSLPRAVCGSLLSERILAQQLTRLLTDSLGGNTKTSLCATLGPALHNYDETFCTLLLATRAMAVKTCANTCSPTHLCDAPCAPVHLRILHALLFIRYARVNERVETASQQKGKAQASALLSQMLALRSEVDRLKREQARTFLK